MRWGAKGWLAHLPVPDVGGQYLILLILGKEKELDIGGLVGWGPPCIHEPQEKLLLCVPISLRSESEEKGQEKGQPGKVGLLLGYI